MTKYFLVFDTLRDAGYCYDYMLRLLRNHIVRHHKTLRIIEIEDYILQFVSEEQYASKHFKGNRDVALNGYYVERQLDRYLTLKGDIYD